MEWPGSINLEHMRVYAAPYGGPIAVVKDPKLFVKLDGGASTRPIIRIFNCVGKLLSSINVTSAPPHPFTLCSTYKHAPHLRLKNCSGIAAIWSRSAGRTRKS